MPVVLGHALSMKAIHGGKAKDDKIDAQKIALLLRGGMLPQAYVYPAAMRATRDLLRRRMHFMRNRAACCACPEHRQPVQPARVGKKIADKANRAGVADRFPIRRCRSVSQVDLALLGHYDDLRRDIESAILQTAEPHNAHTRVSVTDCPWYWRNSELGPLDEIPAIARFPRVQDRVSAVCQVCQGVCW